MFKYGFEEGNLSRKMNALFRNIIRLVISGYMRAVSQIVAISSFSHAFVSILLQ